MIQYHLIESWERSSRTLSGVRGALRQSLAEPPTRLPPVLPCLPWFFSLFDAKFFIVFFRAVGHFLKFLFLLVWLCMLFDKALVAALVCAALAMCLQIVSAFLHSINYITIFLHYFSFGSVLLFPIRLTFRLLIFPRLQQLYR